MPVERPPYIEQIRAESRGLKYRPAKRRPAPPGVRTAPDPFDESRYVFTVCTGNRWMELGERQPRARMLFGEFWHQGELCILFADTNAGKSVLAVQIGDSITRAQSIGPFACNAPPARVLYIDFELTTTQFYQRYSNPKGNYEFTGDFMRAQFNPGMEAPGNYCSYDDFLIAGLENKIRLVNASVLIIDNITCLRGGTENAQVALRLIRNLKSLQADHHLSILVLAHTPKRRNPARPLAANDLHGSKLLINFADSAFAIGQSSTHANLCYLKQIKQRNTQQIYNQDNVCLCRITQPGNFLHFEFEGNGPERPHLQGRIPVIHTRLTQQAAQLSTQGLSQRQIARQLNIAVGTVNKLLHAKW